MNELGSHYRPRPAPVLAVLPGGVGRVFTSMRLAEAGIEHVVVLNSGADLNAYSKLEGQSACCSPAPKKQTGLPIVSSGCCGSGGSDVHEGLADLLKRYNVNDYAASVKVYAVKPAQ